MERCANRQEAALHSGRSLTGQPGAVFSRLIHVVELKLWVFPDNLLCRIPIAQQLEDKVHRNAEASYRRLTSTDVGIDCDAIKCHEVTVLISNQRRKSKRLWMNPGPQELTGCLHAISPHFQLHWQCGLSFALRHRGNTVHVTTHGRPTAMLVPVNEKDIEDALLAYSPVLRKKIEEGLKDVRAGRTMRLSVHKARRKKKHARKA